MYLFVGNKTIYPSQLNECKMHFLKAHSACISNNNEVKVYFAFKYKQQRKV